MTRDGRAHFLPFTRTRLRNTTTNSETKPLERREADAAIVCHFFQMTQIPVLVPYTLSGSLWVEIELKLQRREAGGGSSDGSSIALESANRNFHHHPDKWGAGVRVCAYS
ncbi:hypothetical protein EmuJ_000212400 [Echinococcus multilocularis]|uniref:Uncharacterized protein n=1 Tax=Echinococcus multilocularis TaxID=6211 RepID=A0A087W0U4_ECHMU|nr:hypothetical protein EmuJ_000212400 [Echinococcus multilocularis]